MVDEWVFAAWQPHGDLGVISGHRLIGSRAWYWSALAEAGQDLLHLTEWHVAVRAVDPFIVKAPEMWAEHTVVAAMDQWTIANEAFFVALSDPADALGRAYGRRTPVAMDLEWYATGEAAALASPSVGGYEQRGVVHGEIEIMHRPNLELVEAPAYRWRRWGATLGPLELAPPIQTSLQTSPGDTLRAPIAFPDGTVADWRLGRGGWVSWH